MNNEEPWYGHKFKKINDTTWKCDCGEEIHTCIPDGYALVPAIPTREMIDAWRIDQNQNRSLESSYLAMIKAAQESE